MTGVSIDQWRGNIGLFDRKKIVKSSKGSNDQDGVLIVQFLLKALYLFKSLEFLYNLLLLFSYCTMTVTLFPIFLVIYLCFEHLLFADNSSNSLHHKIPSHSLRTFLEINLIPRRISCIMKYSFKFLKEHCPQSLKNALFFIIVLNILLLISGIEVNPGPNFSKQSKLSFAIWNLDSIPARDFARIPLIESFQASYNFDIFGVCESLLNKNIKNDDILINGFSPDPFRADKPENTRNGGVCLYFKENLPIKERSDLETIPETIVAEVKLNRKKIFFVLSYCHPNLSSTEFDEYVKSLERIYQSIDKENPALTIITGDFNARSPLFWENDSGNREGCVLNDFLISNNLEELINEPTHIRDDGSQSCIDLICTDQPYFFY